MSSMYRKTIVHPLPAEPPLVRRFLFSAELFGPVHTTYLRDDAAVANAEEMEIDGDWLICCDMGAAPALARDRLHGEATPEEKLKLLDEMEAMCREQLRLIAEVRPLLEKDSHLGFHGEAYTYLLDENGLRAAEVAAGDILRRRIPDWRRRVQPTGAIASDFA